MILEATQPLEINIDGDVHQLDTGQVFNLPDKRAGRAWPFIEEGLLKEVTSLSSPIESLDEFWSQEILPRLSRLHLAGRLPDLATCPLWNEVDCLWQVSPPAVEKVRAAMTKAVQAYERAGQLFKERG